MFISNVFTGFSNADIQFRHQSLLSLGIDVMVRQVGDNAYFAFDCPDAVHEEANALLGLGPYPDKPTQ
ncbi:hypothetical protein IGB42_02054 [Andreprevotia sp. IGB-42]|uniref:hypothetical protein n=1 Tax=Andreprevotia sp. IGB-42 TaxID=2497473 RepID=UPI0013591B57|nr:hypothetical protein [Andreprevotia sp. IGB-42]KAF0813701.1 hypothetical protein IGB42_02054 [Andreprevotia sp. IGB-42]